MVGAGGVGSGHALYFAIGIRAVVQLAPEASRLQPEQFPFGGFSFTNADIVSLPGLKEQIPLVSVRIQHRQP
jgi:hypothetical protein